MREVKQTDLCFTLTLILPAHQSVGPLPEGCEPLRLISIFLLIPQVRIKLRQRQRAELRHVKPFQRESKLLRIVCASLDAWNGLVRKLTPSFNGKSLPTTSAL